MMLTTLVQHPGQDVASRRRNSDGPSGGGNSPTRHIDIQFLTLAVEHAPSPPDGPSRLPTHTRPTPHMRRAEHTPHTTHPPYAPATYRVSSYRYKNMRYSKKTMSALWQT